MAPPATNLSVGHLPNFPHSAGLPINNNSSSSRSSEEEPDKLAEDGSIDTATARSIKRPRGRPPGSKNKPKTPICLSVDPQDALCSHVLEVAPGADVASCLAAYARERGRGISVLNASGSVSSVAFRHGHPENSSSLPLFLKGSLDIISLSGTVLPDNPSVGQSGLTVFVSGPNGQVMGGPVEGRLVAEGAVIVVAATFSTATYEKLPFVGPAGEEGTQNPGPGQNPDSGGYHRDNDNMNMGLGGGQEISYANWFLQQQPQQQQINGRQLYFNN